MKQFDPVLKEIGEYKFYIRPLPAFKAANISGELFSVLGPLLSGLLPYLGQGNVESKDEVAAGALADAFSKLSGERVEALMKRLLTDYQTINVEGPDTPLSLLTVDLCNEVFCGSAQDMYVLAYHVINQNFGGFFDGLGSRFGSALGALMEKTPTGTTEPST